MQQSPEIKLNATGLKKARDRLESELVGFEERAEASPFLNKSKQEIINRYFAGSFEEQFAIAYYVLSSAQYLALDGKASQVLRELFSGCETAAKLAELFSNDEARFKSDFIKLANHHPVALCLFCADLCDDFLSRFRDQYEINIANKTAVSERFNKDFATCEFQRILGDRLSSSLASFCLKHFETLANVISGAGEQSDLKASLEFFTKTKEFKTLQQICQTLESSPQLKP